MNRTGTIYGINGPVIYLKGDTGFKISEMVYVGEQKLVGEVIGLKKGMTTVQVFEETTGLRPGETVTATGDAISVLLGPGIIHNIFDGIQRPLEESQNLPENIFPGASAWTPWIHRKNGRYTLRPNRGIWYPAVQFSPKPRRLLPSFINPWYPRI